MYSCKFTYTHVALYIWTYTCVYMYNYCSCKNRECKASVQDINTYSLHCVYMYMYSMCSCWLLSHLKRAHQVVVDWHHTTCVVIVATVVRSREERHQLSTGKELVPILHDLWRTRRGENGIKWWSWRCHPISSNPISSNPISSNKMYTCPVSSKIKKWGCMTVPVSTFDCTSKYLG